MRRLYDPAAIDGLLQERSAALAGARAAELARWAKADVCTAKEFARVHGLSVPRVTNAIARARTHGQIAAVNPGERPARYPRRSLEAAVSTPPRATGPKGFATVVSRRGDPGPKGARVSIPGARREPLSRPSSSGSRTTR